jgi:hypothetical protein
MRSAELLLSMTVLGLLYWQTAEATILSRNPSNFLQLRLWAFSRNVSAPASGTNYYSWPANTLLGDWLFGATSDTGSDFHNASFTNNNKPIYLTDFTASALIGLGGHLNGVSTTTCSVPAPDPATVSCCDPGGSQVLTGLECCTAEGGFTRGPDSECTSSGGPHFGFLRSQLDVEWKIGSKTLFSQILTKELPSGKKHFNTGFPFTTGQTLAAYARHSIGVRYVTLSVSGWQEQ